LKLFPDTAHLADIETAHSWGVLEGLTTYLPLAAREGLEFHDLIHQRDNTQALAGTGDG